MKKLLLAPILALLLLVSGCKDYSEIEDLSIVTAVAIDPYEDKTIRVCLEICTFKNDSVEIVFVEAVGKTYSEAIASATSLTGSKLYFNHAQVMIINEDLAYEGIYEILDGIYRNSDFRLDLSLLIAKDYDAKEILTIEPTINSISGAQIQKMINGISSEIPKTNVYMFINDISSKSESGILPVISKVTDYKGEAAREIAGLAIFKDDDLYDFIDKKSTKTLAFLKNNVNNATVINEYTLDTTTYGVISSKSKITPTYEDGNLKFKFEINMDLFVEEQMSKQDVILPETQEKMESRIERAVEMDFNDLIIVAMNNYQCDFLGLEDILYKKYPQKFKEEKLILKDLQYEIDVKCSIKSSGLTLRTFPADG